MERFKDLSYVTEGLEPSGVLKYFEQISQIPRCSYEEENISKFLYDFGRSLGLETIQDKALNVIIKKPGTKGFENAEPVILQGHMDMVCEKNEGTEHDFSKDPIKLRIDGDLLRATGTTLGADNGIAVAMIMEVLASDTIEHPPLEAIITTEEETGMGGVIGFEKKNVSAKRLINIDSEEEGIFCTSCAGGVDARVKFPIERKENNQPKYKLMINGLKGGHSGADIHLGRGNAMKYLGRLLNKLENYQLAYIQGGSKINAIPREAYAIIATDDIEGIKKIAEKEISVYNKELSMDNIGFSIAEIAFDEGVFSDILKNKIITALLLIPNGVQTVSFLVEDLVESSLSLGVLKEVDNKVVFESAVRSSVDTLKYEITDRVQVLSDSLGAEFELSDPYPGWEYNSNSILQGIFKDVYTRVAGKEPEIGAIHAGLECGFFAEKLTDTDGTDLDMISFGPDIKDPHTPDENMSLSSVKRTWEFFLEVLKELK